MYDKKNKNKGDLIMKKMLIGLVFGLIFGISTSVFASENNLIQVIKVSYDIFVNGSKTNTDLPILNYQGNTYVPLRYVTEKLGKYVEWNSKTKTVHIDDEKTNDIKMEIEEKGLVDVDTIICRLEQGFEDGRKIPVDYFTDYNRMMQSFKINGTDIEFIEYKYKVYVNKEIVTSLYLKAYDEWIQNASVLK